MNLNQNDDKDAALEPAGIKYNKEAILRAVNEVLSESEARLTVRQIYYRLVSPPYQLFPNIRKCYKRFDGILTRARETGEVDWTRIEDRARQELYDYPQTYSSASQFVDTMFSISSGWYRRNPWIEQDKHIEVWVEKDALSTLFVEAVKKYRVMVVPSRGNSSFTKIMEAINRFPEDKEVVILHATDHDPAGLMMTKDLVKRFGEYGGNVEIKRIALTIEQVRQFGLASNPTKKADTNTPAYVAEYGDECWELDAVPYNELSKIVNGAVTEEINLEAWQTFDTKVGEERKIIRGAFSEAEEELKRIKRRVVKATAKLGE